MSSSRPAPRLPPGFRFHPTDEELVVHYLKHKAASSPIPVSIITDIELYKFDPWDLPSKANFGEKEWYFFSPRDRKYPNGARPNRAAASGYWKATGTDKPILTPCGDGGHTKVGVKKVLVFYKGRPPKGIKTNWIMHEYRLVTESKRPAALAIRKSHRLDDWVLCRIYRKAHTQNISLDESFPGVEETIPMSSSSVSTISPQPSMEDTKLASNLPRLGSFGALLSDPFYLNMDSLYTDNIGAEGASKHNTFNIPPSRDPNGPTQRNVFQPTLLQEPDGTFRWPFLENKHQIQNLYTNVHRDYI